MGIIKNIKKAFTKKPTLNDELWEVQKPVRNCLAPPSMAEIRAKDTLDELKMWTVELMSLTPGEKTYTSVDGTLQVAIRGYTASLYSTMSGLRYSCSIPYVHGLPKLDQTIFYVSAEVDYLNCLMNDTRYSVDARMRKDLETLLQIIKVNVSYGAEHVGTIKAQRQAAKPWCYEPVKMYDHDGSKYVWL